jgi:hypothetical protein
MHDEQSGARAIKGMRGPMGFKRNTIRFDSVHQLRINKVAPSGWTLDEIQLIDELLPGTRVK